MGRGWGGTHKARVVGSTALLVEGPRQPTSTASLEVCAGSPGSPGRSRRRRHRGWSEIRTWPQGCARPGVGAVLQAEGLVPGGGGTGEAVRMPGAPSVEVQSVGVQLGRDLVCEGPHLWGSRLRGSRVWGRLDDGRSFLQGCGL